MIRFRSFSIFAILFIKSISSFSQADSIKPGFDLIYSRQFDKALPLFIKLAGEFPNNPVVILGRGMANSGSDHLDIAITDFNAVEVMLSKNMIMEDTLIARLYMSRGMIYFIQENYANAISDLTKCLNHHYPNQSEAYGFRGVAYGKVEDFGNCFKDLNMAIELNPKNHYAVSNRGYFNSFVGDYNAALVDHTTSIQLHPNDHIAYINRGYTYLELNANELALADFQKSYSLDTTYFPAIVYIGIIYTNTGNDFAALPWYNKAVAMEPTNPTVYYYRGTTLANLGRKSEACTDLTKAVQLGESNAIPVLEKNCK